MLPSPAMRAIRFGAADIQLTVDGEVSLHSSPLVLVANGGSFISPNLTLMPDIAFDDGWLDVLVFSCATGSEILATLASIGAGRTETSPFVTRMRGRQVAIASDPLVWVQLDGDPIGQTPREFSLAPRGLSVITPTK